MFYKELRKYMFGEASDAVSPIANANDLSPDAVERASQISDDLNKGVIPDHSSVMDLYSLVEGVEWAMRQVLKLSLYVAIIPAVTVSVYNMFQEKEKETSISTFLDKYMGEPIKAWADDMRSRGVRSGSIDETWRDVERDGLGPGHNPPGP